MVVPKELSWVYWMGSSLDRVVGSRNCTIGGREAIDVIRKGVTANFKLALHHRDLFVPLVP